MPGEILGRKALYGLDVAPRSWALHRNQVLAEMRDLSGSKREIRCLPMEEDANIWMVVDALSDKVLAYLALYADDILIVSHSSCSDAIAASLEGKWTTTPVAWAEGQQTVSFDGFEVEKGDSGFVVSQKSYTREINS